MMQLGRISTTDGVSQWTANLPTNGKYLEFKLDTGADVNVLPKHLFDKLHPRPKLSRSAVKLSAYNNSDIPVEGKCIASAQHEGKVYKELSMVVKGTALFQRVVETAIEKVNGARRTDDIIIWGLREKNVNNDLERC